MGTVKETTVSRNWIQDWRQIVEKFLAQCQIPYPRPPYDHVLDEETRKEAIMRGYPMKSSASIAPFISTGVAIASTSYSHLENPQHRVFIALYTALLTCADDIFEHDVDTVGLFYQHMTSGSQTPSTHPVLRALESLLREMAPFYGRVEWALILGSTFDFINGLSLEYFTQSMPVAKKAQKFVAWTRMLSGVSVGYGMFIFVGLPLDTYIQALPDLRIYINNANDVMSFYKEEMKGETVNQASLLAATSGISKIAAIQEIADQAADAYMRADAILAPHPEARRAFRSFTAGYIGFHTGLGKRYRLDEVFPT